MNMDNEPATHLSDEDRPDIRPQLRAQENAPASRLRMGGANSSSTTGGSSGGASTNTAASDGGAVSRTAGSDGGAIDATAGSAGGAADRTGGVAAKLSGAEQGAGFSFSPSALSSTNTLGAGLRFAGKLFFGNNKRRAGTGAGVGGIIATFVVLSIASGPGQLVQLSQLLQHDFSSSQSDSESRTNNLLRDYKAYKEDDYRYTRVGLIGQKVMSKVVGQFENAGVKFTGSDVLGRPTAIEVDRAAVEKNFSETKGMSDAEFNDFLNSKFGIEAGSNLSFETAEAGQSYKLDIEGLKAQSINSFLNKTSTKLLGDSQVIAAVKTRVLKQFFGLDSLFHPFSRAIQNKIAAKAAEIKKDNPKDSEGTAENQAASDVEDSQYSSDASNVEGPGEEGFTEAKNTDDSFSSKIGSKLLPGAGALWAAGCTLKGVSGAIVAMNRSLIVLPAAVEATELIGEGSEIQNGGSDLTMAQVGATVTGFTNSQGQDIWSSAALQAMQNPNATSSGGGQPANDLPGEYKQAFGTDTTSSALNGAGDVLLSWFPFHWISGIVPGGECGFVSGLAITVSGIFVQAVSAIANAPDGEAGDIALNAAAQAGEQTVIQGVQGQLLGPVINNIIDRIAKETVAPKLTRAIFSGSLGGGLIADGARAASNSAAILSGGLSLANNASTIVGSAGQEEQQQFHSENLFARMFDVNDYRSLAGHLADDINPNIGTDLQTGISNIFNFGSLASVFGSLFSHVSADSNFSSWTGNYNWGFPQYGIPNNMLNDPALSDPYQNAESVGQYLSSACTDGNGNIGPTYGACGGSNGYTARIMSCFGNSLTYSEDSDVGNNVWDVTQAATAANSDVNPVSDTYQQAGCDNICPDTIADCNNPSEEQWEKIVMFVNDAWNIKALDCAGGYTDTSDQSCADLGNSSSSTGGSGGSTPPATNPTGFGTGTGSFTTNTSVTYPGVNTMLADVKKYANDCSSGSCTTNPNAATFCQDMGYANCSGKCESAAEWIWLGHRGQYSDPYGYDPANGFSTPAWKAALAAGQAHPGDRNPPVGALLIYSDNGSSTAPGHITVYLGNNLVASTDFAVQGSYSIQPASEIETDGFQYVGWMAPYWQNEGGQIGNPSWQ